MTTDGIMPIKDGIMTIKTTHREIKTKVIFPNRMCYFPGPDKGIFLDQRANGNVVICCGEKEDGRPGYCELSPWAVRVLVLWLRVQGLAR